jgi:hypothetical protein
MDINQEIMNISDIMREAGFLSRVKSIVSSVSVSGIVTDGTHEDSDFAVIVRCVDRDMDEVTRRLDQDDSIEIDRIAMNVVGVNPVSCKASRRW